MSYWISISLGILQGLTEFLPVSSSGHLVIVQSILPSFSQPGALFDVVLHAGTLLAVLVYFRHTIIKLNKNYLVLLVVGSIPAALVGYLFSSRIELLFTSVKLVGVSLIISGVLNFLTDKIKGGGKKISTESSLQIGIAQALAIIPGISRSGATIFAGNSLGLKKAEAAQFSFLLSVPAIIGANFLQFTKYGVTATNNAGFYLVGFIAAGVSGYFAIKFVYQFLLAKNFKLFGVYCILVGAFTLSFL